MKPTEEQKLIGQLVKASNNVKVIAGAGTGKSTELRYIAKQVPARNVLVLTFNKANAEETLQHPDRPENLFASTIHSLAYRAVIDPFYKKKLSNYLDYNDINLTDLQQAIYATGLPSVADEKKALVLYRKTILDCVRLFCQSGELHLVNFAESYIKYILVTSPSPEIKFTIPFEVALRLTSITTNYWDNLVEGDAKINHDIYLKLFHLWNCSIKEVWSTEHKRYMTVQVLALDEAQDTNPVVEAIFANQNHLQRVIVGDPNQQLYRWRGAGDTMNQFNNFELGYLSESFRFNSEIARMANIVLEHNNSPMRLIGSGKHTSIDTRAILCRTNTAVLEQFFNLVLNGNYNGKINISTDVKSTFAKMYHLQSAYFNNEIKYPVAELSSITDQASMIEALEYSEELVRLNKLSMKLCDAAGSLYKAQQLLAQYVPDKGELASLTIGTIHSSKGLEYSQVTIADDFIYIKEDDDVSEKVEVMWDDVDMRCLLYVAVTRSMVECVLPWYLRDSFSASHSQGILRKMLDNPLEGEEVVFDALGSEEVF